MVLDFGVYFIFIFECDVCDACKVWVGLIVCFCYFVLFINSKKSLYDVGCVFIDFIFYRL